MKGWNSAIKNAKNYLEPIANLAITNPWAERLFRFGYAAKGVVYAIVGWLAASAALGPGGRTTGTRGALRSLVNQPFGRILLGFVAIGLSGYVLWRLVQAIMDTENQGTDAKAIIVRLSYAGNGLIYGGLAVTAVKIIFGEVDIDNGYGSIDWTALLLAQPFGQWLVGTVGALVIGLGFYEFYQAYTAKFCRKFNLNEMSDTEKTWATRIGRFGLAAKGVVYSIIGFFLIQAARQSKSKQVRGLEGALDSLARQPYGRWLLGVVSLGLIAYGVYYIVQARYRRIHSTACRARTIQKS
ncbi:DUF1206 domain-containing protein [Microcoleus sp. FACHB-SPT15]|uniref:DUF1206 domain-containing protein n=1 Tax=Microcoleus sp. FACHB-SPT15 TaxID=2692830 RepID=UPI001783F313|nr:DUF1206 domain-containing protein [Microcoleus sp. FACHB-SPT15]MBD1807508.1 DUF1206 domain-containing protein [Microcoleus sp. FACHB-SPT15]